MKADFRSDNTSGVAAPILAAIQAANSGTAAAYGADEATAALDAQFSEVFETEVTVFPVGTGTAANALALSALTPSYGAVYCHRQSHVLQDECGAPELFTGGARMVGIEGEHGKFTPQTLGAAIAAATPHGEHNMQPAAVSIAESTEAGTLYSGGEIRALTAVAAEAGDLGVHMDGARFANAVAALDVAPADLTWRAGVDVMSFGATKNGAMAAEAVVFFDQGRAHDFSFRRKRAGQLYSKMRFLSAQLAAYLGGGLWLDNARHANAQAQRLSAGLAEVTGVEVRHPTEANEVFVSLSLAMAAGLEAQGFGFFGAPDGDRMTVRLVTSFQTLGNEVNAFVDAAGTLG